MLFVVEHMEEYLFEWSMHEYIRIADLMPSDHQFIITNAASFLQYKGKHSPQNESHVALLSTKKVIFQKQSLINLIGKAAELGIAKILIAEFMISRPEICLLDMRGKRDLQPSDKKDYRVFVFGGVLGCHPPIDRPKKLRDAIMNYTRMGDLQLSTDTAVHVAILILHQGKTFPQLQFIDNPQFQGINKQGNQACVQMEGFRYLKIDGEMQVSKEIAQGLALEDITYDQLS